MNAVSKPRWFHLTPDRLLLALLPVWGGLFLADHFHWLPKGYAVLLAVTILFVALFVALWFAAAAIFRWRFQYGLCTLLLAMLLTSVGMSWLVVEMERARRQREVLDEIAKLGGKVFYDNIVRSSKLVNWNPPAPVRVAAGWDGSAIRLLRSLLGDDFFCECPVVVLLNDDDDTHKFDTALKRLKAMTPFTMSGYYGHALDDN